MMNLQTVENSMENPRVTVGWGKPQFKPTRRDSAIPDREEWKTTPNDPNNLGAGEKTLELPWRLGEGDTQRLLDYAYAESLPISFTPGRRFHRVYVSDRPAGLLDARNCDFIAWPHIRASESRSYAEILHDEADRRPTKGTCYFIGGEVGAIKIGFSVDVASRLKSLQSGSPVLLSILASCPGGEARETAYHSQFASTRLHGEWFERTPELLAEIERLSSL